MKKYFSSKSEYPRGMKIYVQRNKSRKSPDFVYKEFFPKRSKYCLCIHVINEGSKIQKQLKRMRDVCRDIDVLIADGGSTDGSLEQGFLRTCGVRSLLIKTGPGKLSAQMRMAMLYSLEKGYKGIIFMDGNNKDDPTEYYRFVEKLDEGYDHIQGSRFIKGGIHRNTPILRLLPIRLIHAPLLSITSGYWYTDTTNGFRAYSSKFLSDKRVKPFREVFGRYELHYYLSRIAAKLKFRIIEVPVTRIYPKGEKIPTKISPIKGNLIVLDTLLKCCFGYYDKRKK